MGLIYQTFSEIVSWSNDFCTSELLRAHMHILIKGDQRYITEKERSILIYVY